ncbi:hypothetical protein [Aquabacterium sp.]|uniref:hypothetical protein n=1 Tax=Aquabacterium sp. TaxID=1872578 RepID=UPI002D80B803|nr:hypothetical protein [Aquabacterium sp.]
MSTNVALRVSFRAVNFDAGLAGNSIVGYRATRRSRSDGLMKEGTRIMPSLEEFRQLVHEGKLSEAFTAYELDFNSEAFDIFGKQDVQGYETDIYWSFEGPNKIKMNKSASSDGGTGKKIYYLPWNTKKVTSVQLDGTSPGYFVTSHFSNCRFTMNYLDAEGKSVFVQHVAGDTGGGSMAKGTQERDDLEIKVPQAVRTRRFSVSGHKAFAKSGRELMKERAKQGTTYYDSCARVFGVRSTSGGWVFYMQDIDHKEKVIGFKDSK